MSRRSLSVSFSIYLTPRHFKNNDVQHHDIKDSETFLLQWPIRGYKMHIDTS